MNLSLIGRRKCFTMRWLIRSYQRSRKTSDV